MRTLALALSSTWPIACSVAAPAVAQQAIEARADTESGRRDVVPALPEREVRGPYAVAAIDDQALGSVAGREDTKQLAQSEQTAAVSRNSVGDNAVTGEARIDGNAFQNMSGLSILNVNTGNNVAINAAMTVNISIQPGP